MVWIIIILTIFFLVPFVYGLINGFKNNPKSDETTKEDLNEIHRLERIEILDNTLVQYNKLLDSLSDQLRHETNEKERSKILAKQITTLEKYNKALEKREKLDS